MIRACWLVALCWLVGMVAAVAKNGRQKVRVVSDIHAGSCWQGNQTILFEFLGQTARDEVDVLVLNGDIYDFWLVPLDKPMPSIADSIANGLNTSLGFDMHRFRSLLQSAAKKVATLHEDNGNHDMWLTGSLASGGLPDATVLWDEGAVSQWRVRFEHGHMHSLFNQVPPGTNKLPIGYYVTRAVATYACQSNERIQHWLNELIWELLGTIVLDDVSIETLMDPYLFKILLRRIIETAADNNVPSNMSVPVVGVVRNDQIPIGGDTCANYTLAEFVEDYADTLDRFVKKVGRSAAARLIMADVISGSLDLAVGQSSINESLVVVGHTHVPDLIIVDRDHPEGSPTPDVLVANAGGWVADDNGMFRHSYVDITIDDMVEDFPECYAAKNGSDYRGMVHSTENATACRVWDKYDHSRSYFEAFGSVAFCRNLGEQTRPWCYTGVFSWGYCSVGPPAPKCEVEKVRGAVDVGLFSFPTKRPLKSASRSASTGSRWQMPLFPPLFPPETELLV